MILTEKQYDELLEKAPKSKYLRITVIRHYNDNNEMVGHEAAINWDGIGSVSAYATKAFIYDLNRAIEWVENFNNLHVEKIIWEH